MSIASNVIECLAEFGAGRRVSAAIASIEAGLDHESIDADDQEARAAARNYRENYSVWALRVFDSAAAGAIDDCSRSLIEAPTAAQLPHRSRRFPRRCPRS